MLLQAYMRQIGDQRARLRLDALSEYPAWINVMKFFSRLYRKNKSRNLITTLERQRLNRTMPGQTGAMVGAKFGFLV